MKYIGVFLIILLVGCTSKPVYREFAVDVNVVDDEQIPVSSAIVTFSTLDSKKPFPKKQRTDKNGTAHFSFWGTKGESLKASVQCPNRWTPASDTLVELRSRALTTIDGKKIKPEQITFVCIPPQKKHVVVVQTRGAHRLTVKYNGKSAAMTDAQGIAQFAIQGAPGQLIQLALDTSSQPHLRPQMPVRQLTLPAKRRFLIFEQTFSTVSPPKKRRRNSRRVGVPKRL
ncbi:MAG: hypothetical protein JXX29_16805 [Deltaproteobacteria bacterium]|nr:hypothetical protein [Deltaproteobacteria bacterium]MBN2673346.1 hypothetical protein [Deltaproteobacteria bacterium]